MYIFSIVGFLFFRNHFMKVEDKFFYCKNMFQCFLSLIWNGLSGQLFEVVMEQDLDKDAFSTAGWIAVFHILFFLVITVIALNAIFGIIVDTFSELRDLKVL